MQGGGGGTTTAPWRSSENESMSWKQVPTAAALPGADTCERREAGRDGHVSAELTQQRS